MAQTSEAVKSTEFEMEQLIAAVLKRNKNKAEQIARNLDMSTLSISQRIFVAKSGILTELMLQDSDIAVRYAASKAR